jgi:hypothetical protein
MMKTMQLDPAATRASLGRFPDVAAQESLEPPRLESIYVPMGHQKALSLDASVVVGMRGAGKSLWTAVLSSPEHRTFVATLIHHPALANVDVRIGFGLDESNAQFPSEETLRSLVTDGHEPIAIWRAVALSHAYDVLQISKPFGDDWHHAVQWVTQHAQEVGIRFAECDKKLQSAGKTLLILFDALDRLAGTWDDVRQLLTGALQLGLQCRSFRQIRLKFFLLPNMEEDDVIWQFRDSSKLRHSKVELSWSTADLYGLILMLLANDSAVGSAFRQFVESRTNIPWHSNNGVFSPPRQLTTSDEKLRPMIEAIAGAWMGHNPRRGFTYTWIPTHLADASARISPRSFILAFRRAAEYTENRYQQHQAPLHYEAIQQGVTAASEIRIEEIKEDYPWVRPLLEAARGLTVPCEVEELTNRWTGNPEQEVRKGTGKLPPRRFTTDPFRSGKLIALIDDLVELAVLYRTTDGRVNMPDIFRVGFGIKRKGGVKPPR